MLPEFKIFGEYFYTYPLFIGIAIALGLIQLKSKNIFKTHSQFIQYYLGLLIFSWLGAKLLFLLSVDRSVMNLPRFWLGGGFVFYGGLFTGTLFTFLFFKYQNISQEAFNKLVPILVISHLVGRAGCFLSGCCFGKLISKEMFGDMRHPTQLYEVAFLLFLFIYFKVRSKKRKSIVVPYLLSYAVFRFFVEYLRGDAYRGFIISGISTSQGLSILVILSIAGFTAIKRTNDSEC